MTESFPLHWPEGWPRTPAAQRRRWPAEARWTKARDDLMDELGLLGGRHLVISSDVELRANGLPYAKQVTDDPGVAVWFVLGAHQRCIACDRWDTVPGNMRALRATVEALRGLQRWGSTEILRRTWKAFAAIEDRSHWSKVLGIPRDATVEQIKHAWRRLAAEAHPDHGGRTIDMAALNAARDQALAERRTAG